MLASIHIRMPELKAVWVVCESVDKWKTQKSYFILLFGLSFLSALYCFYKFQKVEEKTVTQWLFNFAVCLIISSDVIFFHPHQQFLISFPQAICISIPEYEFCSLFFVGMCDEKRNNEIRMCLLGGQKEYSFLAVLHTVLHDLH